MKKMRADKSPGYKPAPFFKWQTGAYTPHADFKLLFPPSFLMLCRLMEVTPQKVLTDFIHNLSGCGTTENMKKDPTDLLIQYFILSGYGDAYYTEADIQCIFKEIGALAIVFPHNGKDELLNLYARWREEHYKYWFDKWYFKVKRRKIAEDIKD